MMGRILQPSGTPPLPVSSPNEKGGGGAVTSSLKNLGSAGPADSTLKGLLIWGYRMSSVCTPMLGAAAHGICSSYQRRPFLLELSQPATE
ncbi:hypothetical protein LAZ67_13001544 [Cordylochernes scorpioides]|uniref:Uncharacterized protein n=1 Tax=Cordylochernes scorpioides TaxID=51811 RepID=A0ABY6L6E5_9ARAC|nr:hypothetical protein LAZ67_13001544 [Cordylochernes scorpioides]